MKKFFNKIVAFLKMLFGINLNSWIKEHVRPSIDFVERFKNILNSPVADILTTLIPGDWDDKLRNKMIDNLTKALTILYGADAFADATTLEDKLLKIIQLIKTLTPAMQQAMLFKLASELSKVSSGSNVIKGHSIDLLTQTEYSKKKEGFKEEEFA